MRKPTPPSSRYTVRLSPHVTPPPFFLLPRDPPLVQRVGQVQRAERERVEREGARAEGDRRRELAVAHLQAEMRKVLLPCFFFFFLFLPSSSSCFSPSLSPPFFSLSFSPFCPFCPPFFCLKKKTVLLKSLSSRRNLSHRSREKKLTRAGGGGQIRDEQDGMMDGVEEIKRCCPLWSYAVPMYYPRA